jgi:hypothetical protein
MAQPYVQTDYVDPDYFIDPIEPAYTEGIRFIVRDARLALTQSETRRTKLE